MSIGDNLEAFGLDLIPEPTDVQYRTASQQVALNGRSREDVRFLLTVLGYLPYPAIATSRGGTPRPVIRECNGYFARRAMTGRMPA
jgi:hypothetical protein